jgi:hypothetical protein
MDANTSAQVTVSESVKVTKTKKAEKKSKTNVKKMTMSSWAEKFREGTIGRLIAEGIAEGKMTNEQILESVKKAKKGAKTTYGCIAWYRSSARKAGVLK